MYYIYMFVLGLSETRQWNFFRETAEVSCGAGEDARGRRLGARAASIKCSGLQRLCEALQKLSKSFRLNSYLIKHIYYHVISII